MKKPVFLCRLVVLATCVLLLGSSMLSLGSIPRVHGADSQSTANATWLWNTKLIETSSDELIQFMNSQHVDTIFLQISSSVSKSSYSSFIRSATEHQIQVYALNGAPDWAKESSLSKLNSFMNWIRDYQNSVQGNEKFSGISVDIEPYLLKEWTSNWTALVTEWQSNVTYLAQRAEEINLPLNAALPFWLDKYKAPGENVSLSYWMISKFDSVSLMTYRDTATAIYELGKIELSEAALLNKKVYLSVETKASNEGNFVTFYEEGAAYMGTELQSVRSKALVHSSFAGIAVHDIVGWMNMEINTDNLRTLLQ